MNGLYRSRHGLLFGVCRGLSDYSRISAFWVRLGFVVLALSTAVFPVMLVYLVLAIMMRPEPSVRLQSDEDWDLYDVYSSSRKRALSRLQRRMLELDRRARRIEDAVTSRGFDWEQRLHSS